MASISIGARSSYDPINYLFKDPLCKKLSIVNRVANIAFHIFTLCIPLAIYHTISYCRSKISHYSDVKDAKHKGKVLPHTSIQTHPKQDVLTKHKQDKSHHANDPYAATAPHKSTQTHAKDVLTKHDPKAATVSLHASTQHLNQDILAKYRQEKFQYTNDPQPSLDSLFLLQQSITLPKEALKIEVDMYDTGRVEHVSGSPVFLYTDYLGPCVAAIGRCKMLDSSMLIGITHLYPEDGNYNDQLSSKLSSILSVNRANIKDVNKEKIIQKDQFKPQKLTDLIDKFLLHPSYKGEEIELFFAGGNGDLYDAFWRELTVEYAKSVPKVKVIGSYFNPYHATQEIQEEIRGKKLKLSLMAGITNHGSIHLHKSHAIDFIPNESQNQTSA